MIFDGIAEIFRGKKTEAPVAPAAPSVDLQTLKQDEANLNQVITQGGKDFRNPADANRLREIRNQVAEIESHQTQAPVVAQAEVSQPEVQPVIGPQILNQTSQEVVPTPIQTTEEAKAA